MYIGQKCQYVVNASIVYMVVYMHMVAPPRCAQRCIQSFHALVTIYKATKAQLLDLGVSKSGTDTLLKKLSHYAIVQMQRIVHTTKALERTASAGKLTWKPRRPGIYSRDSRPGTKRKRGVG